MLSVCPTGLRAPKRLNQIEKYDKIRFGHVTPLLYLSVHNGVRRGCHAFARGMHRAHNVVSAPRKSETEFMNLNKWNFSGL